MNRLQISALLGVHPDTVSDYARQGMPVLRAGAPGREGRFDAVKCVGWWRAQQGKNAKENAQTRALTAQAELNELKLARERGDLWPSDVVIREGQAFSKAWAAHVRALPKRLRAAGAIRPEDEPMVAAHCRQLLEEISRWRTAADATASTELADATGGRGVN